MDVQWQNSRVDSPFHHYDLHHRHHMNPMLQQHQQQQNGYYNPNNTPTIPQQQQKMRKRKAETAQDNERLSKRLSLLNLERNGHKLYVPIQNNNNPTTTSPSSSSSLPPPPPQNANDTMQLDDTKHKVYIYDLDAELSSCSSDSECDGGSERIVFLPDIEKHLARVSRIPPAVFANQDGELAGHNMQMVLYSETEPSSLTVPREHDSVRKAILEARARLRDKQQQREEEEEEEQQQQQPLKHDPMMNGFENTSFLQNQTSYVGDSDAMDMD
ncbi:hypothetical protein GGS20DRAFT_543017 [Poronia punctata]|nr:hypothetical protein GGS20DRAFT_543017 [Poronia punctata]